MTYEEFVANRATQYGLSVEIAERVGVAFWMPNDPLAKVIQVGLSQEGGGSSLHDWLNYASRNDLSAWLEQGKIGSDAFVQIIGYRYSNLGTLLYLKVRTHDYRPLSWREVWGAYSAIYPDRWAVQFFPPASELLDESNVYHLFVLETPVEGVNVRHRDPDDA